MNKTFDEIAQMAVGKRAFEQAKYSGRPDIGRRVVVDSEDDTIKYVQEYIGDTAMVYLTDGTYLFLPADKIVDEMHMHLSFFGIMMRERARYVALIPVKKSEASCFAMPSYAVHPN
jgi:hypothetical protein